MSGLGRPPEDRLLTAPEVAAMFRVNKKAPARWVMEGKLSAIRTPGGHLRFRESDVARLLAKRGDPS